MKNLLRTAMLFLIIIFIAGCSRNNDTEVDTDVSPLQVEPLITFEIPVPTAPGDDVESNEKATIDYSNVQDGYVIVKYMEKTINRLRVVLTAPHGESYVYVLGDGGVEEIIPLTEGDGEYQIGIYEQMESDEYSLIVSITVDVKLTDEFIPFLHPNQFVNYTINSELVKLAAELTKDTTKTEEKFTVIYNYVVDNFTYDYDRASNVQSGYIPNLDDVLHKKEGICFDYSALVTAMLRSQGIPTKLEIGYHGDEYHAWISKFCEENGWIERRYHHDGEEWCMMDPTVESGERKVHLSRQEARNDDEYRLMYNY